MGLRRALNLAQLHSATGLGPTLSVKDQSSVLICGVGPSESTEVGSERLARRQPLGDVRRLLPSGKSTRDHEPGSPFADVQSKLLTTKPAKHR